MSMYTALCIKPPLRLVPVPAFRNSVTSPSHRPAKPPLNITGWRNTRTENRSASPFVEKSHRWWDITLKAKLELPLHNFTAFSMLNSFSRLILWPFHPAEIITAERSFKNEANCFLFTTLLFPHHLSILNNPQDVSWRLENAPAFPISRINCM